MSKWAAVGSVVVLACAGHAWAAPLVNPGDSNVAIGQADHLVNILAVLNPPLTLTSASGDVTFGNLKQKVEDTPGGLTFCYDVELSLAYSTPGNVTYTQGDITSVAVDQFAGQTTHVDYEGPQGDNPVHPTMVDRSGGVGNVFTFHDFNDTLVPMPSGEARDTQWMCIETTATSYLATGDGDVTLSVTDSNGVVYTGTAHVTGLYVPVAVPEPASLGLLGVAGLAILRRRRA